MSPEGTSRFNIRLRAQLGPLFDSVARRYSPAEMFEKWKGGDCEAEPIQEARRFSRENLRMMRLAEMRARAVEVGITRARG